MIVVHITNITKNRFSGISNVIPNYMYSQKNKVNLKWINLNEQYPINSDLESVYICPTKKDLFTKKFYLDNLSKADIVIFHGIFFWQYRIIAQKITELNIPYIVVPHGSLTEIAMNRKRIKKKVFMSIYFEKFIAQSSSIHFLSEGEMKNSKNYNEFNYFIISNGIEVPTTVHKTYNNREVTGVFIGRKNIKIKGIDLLLKACSELKLSLLKSGAQINIYGPSEDNADRKINEYINKNGLSEVVNIFPPVYNEDKSKILQNSDFFILTSRSEGSPIAVLEALANGLPCLVTSGTNMDKQINSYDAGWACEGTVESIKDSLESIINAPLTIQRKGLNARSLSKSYSWDIISQELIQEYQKVVERNLYKND